MKKLAENLQDSLVYMRNSNGERANRVLAKTLSATGTYITLEQLKRLMPEKAQEIESMTRAKIEGEFAGHDPSMVNMDAKAALMESDYKRASFVIHEKEDGTYSLLRSKLVDRADIIEFMPFKPESVDTLEFARVAREAMERQINHKKFDGTSSLTPAEIEATIKIGANEAAKLESKEKVERLTLPLENLSQMTEQDAKRAILDVMVATESWVNKDGSERLLTDDMKEQFDSHVKVRAEENYENRTRGRDLLAAGYTQEKLDGVKQNLLKEAGQTYVRKDPSTGEYYLKRFEDIYVFDKSRIKRFPIDLEALKLEDLKEVSLAAIEKHGQSDVFRDTSSYTGEEIKQILSNSKYCLSGKLEQRRQAAQASMGRATKDVREPEMRGAFAALKSLFSKKDPNKDDKDK